MSALRPLEIGTGPSPWFVATVRPSEADMRAPVAAARRVFAAVLLLALALALGLGLMTAHRLSRPLLRLAAAAVELGRGNLAHPVEAKTGDEIEVLGRAMSRMAAELRDLYQGLEDRISAKTAQLTEANTALQQAYTQLQAAHRKLQESEAELVQSEKLSSIGRLAASVAHEINNPAGIVSMYAQLLREETRDRAACAKLDLIIESAQKVSRTVGELLDYSRKRPRALERVAIGEAVDAGLAELRARNPELGATIQREIDPGLLVLGDAQQLSQVFRNLIENALHATRGTGGSIRLRARRRIGQIETLVEDDGPGIPAEALPRIFEPFFTTKPGKSGTGLGLFVSYGIVRSHHGTLEAENRAEGGTRFLVACPPPTWTLARAPRHERCSRIGQARGPFDARAGAGWPGAAWGPRMWSASGPDPTPVEPGWLRLCFLFRTRPAGAGVACSAVPRYPPQGRRLVGLDCQVEDTCQHVLLLPTGCADRGR